MMSIQNLLFHFERIQETNNSHSVSWFEKNIQVIYKNNPQLLEKSIQNILAISDINDLKSVYDNFSTKSTYKLHTFQKLQKDIAEQPVIHNEENSSLFSSFIIKTSSYWKQKITQSKRYKYLRQHIQDETIFWKKLERQWHKQIYQLSYRTLVFDFHVSKQKKAFARRNRSTKLK
ncbi:hypothetical protein [Bacillus toyonensis]|uniref:Uncharacterized protein n=1 Tax=Bacillus toyonensis TaxID=155322 RepID=A0A2A8H9D0_9BACI|nr:hypothetical protein [Bacillus toyonensis]PEP96970.1 hypothetical protein CN585_24860 [Bacillus toyonensis]